MYIRRNILPRSLKDGACVLFVLFIIPCIYWFELFVVLPTFYEQWTFWYNLHFVCGSFVGLNAVTNLMAIILIDTSVKGYVMPTEMKPGWRFCCTCETIAPPRSWHCEVCNTCILKRDHHCIFAGCCIGHKNSRYFMMFTIYVFIAMVYSTYFNTFFIWPILDFTHKLTWLKMIFPLVMFIVDNSENQLHLLLYLIVVFIMVFISALIWFHTSLTIVGQVTHERNLSVEGYNYGLFRNIEIVYGKRWYLTWISPFVASELPHDGINWEHKDTVKNK